MLSLAERKCVCESKGRTVFLCLTHYDRFLRFRGLIMFYIYEGFQLLLKIVGGLMTRVKKYSRQEAGRDFFCVL